MCVFLTDEISIRMRAFERLELSDLSGNHSKANE